MHVVCAWCQKEGRSHLLRVGEPLDDTSETHGICDRHQQALLEMFPSNSFPSTRWLFIVPANDVAAYTHLVTLVRDIVGVTVIMDRRREDRRRGGERPVRDRRRGGERRVRRPERSGLGYMLVRFAPRGFDTPAGSPTTPPANADGVDRAELALRA
jgi:hypothetical protein